MCTKTLLLYICRLINLLISFIVLFGGLHLSQSEKLNCSFKDEDFNYVGTLYTCIVKLLVTPNVNMTIDGYYGVHEPTKSDNDVKAIWIHITDAEYIPGNLGFLFNLTTLSIQNSQLKEIKATDFDGMQELEYLNLFDNYLSYLPSDTFSSLKKLKRIHLGANKIEEIPNDLFSNNLILEKIHLHENNIKYLSPEVFDGLTKLNFVTLEYNPCGNKTYTGTHGMIKLKNETKDNCKIPVDDATTQSLIEVLRNEMQEKINKLEKKLLEAEKGQFACVAKNVELNKILSELLEQLDNINQKKFDK